MGRDTTTPYNDAGRFDPAGIPRPSVNSHYARQTIWWAMPLALSGQQYDAQLRPRRLDFKPHPELLGDTLLAAIRHGTAAGPVEWPVLLPQASAVAKLRVTHERTVCTEFHVLSGSLDLAASRTRLTVTLPGTAAVHL